jgi:hypothetical protein
MQAERRCALRISAIGAALLSTVAALSSPAVLGGCEPETPETGGNPSGGNGTSGAGGASTGGNATGGSSTGGSPTCPANVDDGDKCTTDTCDPATALVKHTVIDGCIPEYDVTILLPPRVELSTVVLGASDELKVGKYVTAEVEDPPGSFATCTNVGSTTNVGLSAGLGDLWGRRNVTLESGATIHGSLYSTAAAILDGATVTGSQDYNAVFDPVQQISWKVTFPATMSPGFSLDQAEPLPISPAWYGGVSVKNNSTLALQAGTYYFQSLEIDPTATLRLDQSRGPIILYVQWLLSPKGHLVYAQGGKTNALVVYLGLADVEWDERFVGNLIAPNARLLLPRSDYTHVGTFYAKNLEVYSPIIHRPLFLGDFLRPCMFGGPPIAVGLNTGGEKSARVVVLSGSLGNIQDLAMQDWDDDRRCDAVAWGDVDGDQRDELITGSSPHDNQRVQVRNDVENGFGVIANEIGFNWGSDYGVTALATGDLDGDGRDEIVVGRNGGDGREVIILDDALQGYAVIQQPDLGGRTVRDLAIGDADNDGHPEVLVALEGRSDNPDNRVRVIQDSSEGYALSGFANWPDADRHATAIAIGDMEHDRVAEIAVGRSAGDGARIEVYHFDQVTGTYSAVAEWGNEWDSGHYPTKMLMADLDGDQLDELIVGRNARCTLDDTFCTSTPKLLVYGAPLENGAYPETAHGGDGWPPNRGVTALGVSDVDADGVKEILVGKNSGAGDRVEGFRYTPGALTFLAGGGFMWGDDREVRALAVSKDYVCAVKSPPPLPETWCEAQDQFPLRQARVIRAKLNDVLPNLRAGKTRFDLFGTWGNENDSATEAGRAILAGLAAIQLGVAPEDKELLARNFPALVNQYLQGLQDFPACPFTDQCTVYSEVGTKGDFDFVLMLLLEIAYRFRDATYPGSSQYLLDDASLRKLLLVGNGASSESCFNSSDHKDQEPFCSGNMSRIHKYLAFPALEIYAPETENHMLMVNTWAYLANQWVTKGYRGVPPPAYPSMFVNEGSGLETFLLAALGRPLQNGMWETNARAYEAFSIRPIEILASYAEGKVQTAARNALDYLATKYAFQSLHGKRLPPMRRNYEYRERVGVYQNDYLAGQFGVLTGATAFNTEPNCQHVNCAYGDRQLRGFALESALLEYRVPPTIHDLMLHPDNHHPGYGAWTRMQARYAEEHYGVGSPAHYPVPNDLEEQDPGLSARIQSGQQLIESAPEFYFVTQSYLNSAGGKYEHYFLNVPVNLVDESVTNGLDVWSRPTVLLGDLDVGHWDGLSGAMEETFVLTGQRGVEAFQIWPFYQSRNTGVYKNFAYGYLVDEAQWPVVPWGVTVAARQTDQSGMRTFTVMDVNSTSRIFSAPNFYIVIGYLPYSRGIWEIVPRRLFADEQALLEHVLSVNNGSEWEYQLAVSGEKIGLNPDFGMHDSNGELARPFLRIDGSEDTRQQVHEVGYLADNSMPLIQARQVDENYAFTPVTYAYGNGDGVIDVYNPYLGSHLHLDSHDHMNPSRQDDYDYPPCH